MVKQHEQTVRKSGFLPLVLTLAGFSLFLIVIVVFLRDTRAATVAFGGRSPEERAEILSDLRARDSEILNEYGWIDREQGIVRLPIERAMELQLEEINQGQTQN